MFVEYYISLPSGYVMKEIPVPETVPGTLISEDITVRIPQLEQEKEEYMVYSFGKIVDITDDCVEAIQLANQTDKVGTVINEKGRVIWERGIKYASHTIKEISGISIKSSGLTSRQEAVRMLTVYMGAEADCSGLKEEQKVKDFLEEKRLLKMYNLQTYAQSFQ